MDYAGFEDFWTPYLGGQGPAADYVAGLDASARDRLREHVRRAYLDGEPDGPRSYAASAWAVGGVVPGCPQDPGHDRCAALRVWALPAVERVPSWDW